MVDFKKLNEQMKKTTEAQNIPMGFRMASQIAARPQENQRRSSDWDVIWNARIPWCEESNTRNGKSKPLIYSLTKVKCNTKGYVVYLMTTINQFYAHRVFNLKRKSTTYSTTPLTDYVRCTRFQMNPDPKNDADITIDTKAYCPFCELYNKDTHNVYPPSIVYVFGIIDTMDDGKGDTRTNTEFPFGAPKLCFTEDSVVITKIIEDVTAAGTATATRPAIPWLGLPFSISRGANIQSPKTGDWQWTGKSLEEVGYTFTFDKTTKCYSLQDLASQDLIPVYYEIDINQALPLLDGTADNCFPKAEQHDVLIRLAEKHVALMIDADVVPKYINEATMNDLAKQNNKQHHPVSVPVPQAPIIENNNTTPEREQVMDLNDIMQAEMDTQDTATESMPESKIPINAEGVQAAAEELKAHVGAYDSFETYCCDKDLYSFFSAVDLLKLENAWAAAKKKASAPQKPTRAKAKSDKTKINEVFEWNTGDESPN